MCKSIIHPPHFTSPPPHVCAMPQCSKQDMHENEDKLRHISYYSHNDADMYNLSRTTQHKQASKMMMMEEIVARRQPSNRGPATRRVRRTPEP